MSEQSLEFSTRFGAEVRSGFRFITHDFLGLFPIGMFPTGDYRTRASHTPLEDDQE